MFDKWPWMALEIAFVCILGNHTINNDISLKNQWPKPFIIIRIVSGESANVSEKKGIAKYIGFIYYMQCDVGPASAHFSSIWLFVACLKICHAKREIDKWYQSNLPTTYHQWRRLNIEIMLSGAQHKGTRKEWKSKKCEAKTYFIIINWKSRNTH